MTWCKVPGHQPCLPGIVSRSLAESIKRSNVPNGTMAMATRFLASGIDARPSFDHARHDYRSVMRLISAPSVVLTPWTRTLAPALTKLGSAGT